MSEPSIPKPIADVSAQRSIEGRDRHNPKGPSRYAQAKKDEQAK